MACNLRGSTFANAMVRWEGTMDDEGHREYQVVVRVESGVNDGPANVFNTPGLPTPGNAWLVRSDVDVWAWFYPTKKARRYAHKDGEKGTKSGKVLWDVELKASTKPPTGKKCQDAKIENPLFEPQKVSGGSNKYTEEATYDRFLRPLLHSSFEPIRGPAVEFPWGWSTIEIEQNVPFLQLELCSAMENNLNAFPIWGMPPRCVCLTDFRWEKKWWGQCFSYYTRRFTFEVRARRDPITGQVFSVWDRLVGDEGHKALKGRWQDTPAPGRWITENIGGEAPDPRNPQHFVRLQDRNGNLIKIPLNGAGLPAGQIVTLNPSGNNYFIAIDNAPAGSSLSDGTIWAAIVGSTIPQPFDLDTLYVAGNLVTRSGGTFFCIRDIGQTFLQNSFDPALPPYPFPGTATHWISFPFGVSNGGDYVPTDPYTIGTFVRDVGNVLTGQGVHYIQKYDQTNFFLLGVPAIL